MIESIHDLNQPAFLAALEQASLFDLWQFSLAIDRMLKDPGRNDAIRSRLRPGENVFYFDPKENKEICATIMEIYRTQVRVINRHDQKIWTLPFFMLQMDPGQPVRAERRKLDRSNVKVGDSVGYLTRSNQAFYGVVTKLNPKTAEVTLPGGEQWRVFYGDLFPVLEGEGSVRTEPVLIENFDESNRRRDMPDDSLPPGSHSRNV